MLFLLIDGSFVWFERSSLLGVWLPLVRHAGYGEKSRVRWKQSVILILVHVRLMSAIQRQKWPKDQNRLFIVIYTLSNIIWRLPLKRDFQSKICPQQFVSIVQAMASLFRLLSCLYICYWSQLINDFTKEVLILLFWQMVRGGIDMENSRINDYSLKIINDYSLKMTE